MEIYNPEIPGLKKWSGIAIPSTNTKDDNITNAIRDLEIDLSALDETFDSLEIQAFLNITSLNILIEDRKDELKRILIKTEYETTIEDIRD